MMVRLAGSLMSSAAVTPPSHTALVSTTAAAAGLITAALLLVSCVVFLWWTGERRRASRSARVADGCTNRQERSAPGDPAAPDQPEPDRSAPDQSAPDPTAPALNTSDQSPTASAGASSEPLDLLGAQDSGTSARDISPTGGTSTAAGAGGDVTHTPDAELPESLPAIPAGGPDSDDAPTSVTEPPTPDTPDRSVPTRGGGAAGDLTATAEIVVSPVMKNAVQRRLVDLTAHGNTPSGSPRRVTSARRAAAGDATFVAVSEQDTAGDSPHDSDGSSGTDDAGDVDTGDGENLFEDIDVALSPLTGEVHVRRRLLDRLRPHTAGLPAARKLTTAAADPAGEFVESEEQISDRVVPQLNPPRSVSALARVNALADAWSSRDVDALAALAAGDPAATLAASVLAAAAASHLGDPRGIGYLQVAFVNGGDPAADALLGPYLEQLSFHIDLPELELSEQLPCTRNSIGIALACAELAVDDVESAYSVLLELDDAPLVRVVRAQAALDLGWPGRALRTTSTIPRGETDAGRFSAALKLAEGQALAETGNASAAVKALTDALAALDGGTPQLGGQHMRARALFLRAAAHADLKDLDSAWEDLTALTALDPAYPGSAEALKRL
jgi:hypothetical protein